MHAQGEHSFHAERPWGNTGPSYCKATVQQTVQRK